MRRTLLFAAWYNLIWGAIAIAAPAQSLSLLGLDPAPLYPEFWQCLGMVIGVYGIGYAIASRNPVVHWPIVFVGFLGKVFGPLGFLFAVLRGRLPGEMTWMIITNDLIWWLPFAAILWHAAQQHQRTSTVGRSPGVTARAIDPLGRFISQSGATVRELSRRKPLMLVFLRHSGCTFCREALGDIASQRSAIEASGVEVALVHMGQHEPIDLLEHYGLADLHRFRDPQCVLYDSFGLKSGNPLQILGPAVWIRAMFAWVKGHGIGAIDGDSFRLGGVFLIRRGEVVLAHRLSSASDRPNYAELADDVSGEVTRADVATAAPVDSHQ